MPLFDHFRSPLKDRIQWNMVHSGWASCIADHLNTVLPPQFTMEEHVRLGGGVEIEVASYERYEDFTATNGHGPPTAMLTQRWAPPMPTAVGTGMFPDRFEVLIFDQDMGKQLVGAIEIISPGNKDRAEERTRFAGISSLKGWNNAPYSSPSGWELVSSIPRVRGKPATLV